MAAKLPKEVYSFAKAMGIDLKDLEPEAQDMWKMLTELQSRNPAEYEAFIENTLKENKDLVDPSKNKAHSVSSKQTATAASEEGQKMIRPLAGFAIECSTVAGDGIKVREITSGSYLGKLFYVNVCSHEAIQKPKNSLGIELNGDVLRETDGIEIPMIIGLKRDEKTLSGIEALVVDVLVNASVINTSKTNSTFRRELVELVLSCVESETKIEIQKPSPSNSLINHWKITSREYECGRGDEKLVPALFPVQPHNEKNMQSELTKPVLESTSSLVESVLRDRNDDGIDLIPRSTKTIKEKPNIQVVGAERVSKELSVPNNKVSNTLKSGFLNARVIDSVNKVDHSKNRKLPNEREKSEVDKLFANIDNDWTQEVQSKDDSSDFEELLKGTAGPLFKELAGALTSDNTQTPKDTELSSKQSIQSAYTYELCSALKDKIHVEIDQDTTKLEVKLKGLPHESLAKYVLNVSEKEILLYKDINSKDIVIKVSIHQGTIDRYSAKASASTKKQSFTIFAKFCSTPMQ